MANKRFVGFGLAAFAVFCLAAFGLWFWSLGAIASESIPPLRVEVSKGTVEWKESGAGEWKKIETSTEVQPGDSVRTDDGSSAQIRWGDRGVTRLDAKTELTIERAPEDPNAVRGALFQLRLSTGRAWSRVLKLLDVDSGFEVKTDTVVATVRGTSFGIARTASGVDAAVTESVVAISPTASDAQPTLLHDNQWGSFNASGTPTIVRRLTEVDAWPMENRREDALFDEELRQIIRERFSKRLKRAPEWLVELSESAHLVGATGEAKNDLASAYFGRRLAVAISDPSKAANVLAEIDVSRLRANHRALRDIRFALFLQDTRRGFVPDASLLGVLRDIRLFLLADPYARALLIDDQIDAFLNPPMPLTEDETRKTVTSLLTDINDWSSTVPSADPDASLLLEKANALRDRIVIGSGGEAPATTTAATTTQEVLTTQGTPKTQTVTGRVEGVSDSQPAPQSTTSVPQPTPQASCGYRSVSLLTKPSAVSVGESVTLTLYGVCPDGTTDDLTSASVFNPGFPTDGMVTGNVFRPSKEGTITLYGTYIDGGAAKSGSGIVTVRAAKRSLSGVTVTALGPTTLTTGQSSPLDAVATYSDGSTSGIKYICAWSVSDPKLGMISSATFQSLSGTGTVSTICSYTEGGITKSGSVTFTIVLDPALTPDSGTSGKYQRMY